MEKTYRTPLTEVMQAELTDMVMHSNNLADAKQNTFIFEEIVEEEMPDTTTIWNSDPWEIQYSLWDED